MGTFPITTVETTRPKLLPGTSPITSVQKGSPPAVERNPISRQRPIRATSLAGGRASETSGRHGDTPHTLNRGASQNPVDTLPRITTFRAAALLAGDHSAAIELPIQRDCSVDQS